MFQSLIKRARVFAAVAIAAVFVPALAALPIQAQAGSACQAHADAKIINATAADYPEIARMQGITGTTYVKVLLNENGDLADAAIEKSSGNRFLDDAALRAVRAARFSPEVADCANVSGDYLVEVDWQ